MHKKQPLKDVITLIDTGERMIKTENYQDITKKKAVVVYKQSRYDYAKSYGAEKERSNIRDLTNPLTVELIVAHENNLKCIEIVTRTLKQLGVEYDLLCRSVITKAALKNKLVISVGGDGTLLESSHYCEKSPLLGVNSDEKSSIGALCVANASTFKETLQKIYEGMFKPAPVKRLAISIDKQDIDICALNDILFCHKNPASLSRYIISLNGVAEKHRSSGLWVATPAGSTGGIFSSGADILPLDGDRAIFRTREPYAADVKNPTLLKGEIKSENKLIIQSTMSDGMIYIDGTHQSIAISFAQSVELSLSKTPLWLFAGPVLMKNRQNIIKQRSFIRNF